MLHQIWSREVFLIDSVLNTYPWTYIVKDLSKDKVSFNVYKKELFLCKLIEPDSHISKFTNYEFINYATKEEL